MKYKMTHKLLVLSISAVLFFSCQSGSEKKAAGTESRPKTEAELLMESLAQNGDYVNSRQFPSMIKAPTLYESLDSSTLVVDIRSPEVFSHGHIKGAVNVQFSDIPAFFENKIKPFEYEKIVIACYRGQSSSYSTCLLRLMGYGNVYSLRWGMNAWHPDLEEGEPWNSLISSEYTSKLETTENLPPAPGSYPELGTGKTTGEEILKERIGKLFAEGLSGVFLNAQDVFAKNDSFFIINYERKDKYDSGHIPGAVRYKPGGMLGIPEEMLTLPAQKDIVVYCGTGHNSAFAVAYLRLLGYKAHSLRLGNNSFMHDKMLKEKLALSWDAFTPDMLNKYPYVKK